MLLQLPIGSTSKIIQFPIFDSSSTTGALLAGLVFNSAGLTAFYSREGVTGAAVAITLATATKGTWATGGFVAVDGTNMPGWYELHVPDAAFASGAKSVSIHLKGATSMVPGPILIELTATSNQDAVRGGMTSLPASGTLAVNPILNATQTGVTIPTVTTLTGHTAQTGDTFARLGAPTGASVSADVAAVKGDTAAVKVKTDFLPSATAGAAGGVFIAGTNAATTITTSLTTTFTGSVTGSVGSVTGAVGSVTGAVGSVTGAVGSVTGAVGSVTANVNAVLTNGAHGGAAATMQLGGAGGLTSTLTGSVTGSVGSVTGAVGSVTGAVGSVTGAVGSVTGNVGGNVVGSVASVTARVTANTDQINSVATAAARLALSTQGIVTATVGAASTTTSVVTSALDPAAAVIDQFKGKIITFNQATTTANLRGQSTDITANTALGVLTVTALTTAPVSGDTFVIT